MHDHFAEKRQLRLHLIPDPTGEVFARWVFKAGNFVEIVMIETIVGRLECALHVSEIHDPAGLRIDVAAHLQFDAKRMAMEPRAFVASSNIRQSMRCLDRERAEDIHSGNSKTAQLGGCAAHSTNGRLPREFAARDQAAFLRRELEAQLHVPHVQRIALQSEHTAKSTEP